MKECLLVLLTIAFLAGCASVSPSPLPTVSGEENIKNLLVGTWEGDIRVTVRGGSTRSQSPLENSHVRLDIFEVRKDQDTWKVNATINGESLNAVTLYPYGSAIRLEMTNSRSGAIYTLDTHGSNHLIGNVGFGPTWKFVDPRPLVLKKL